MTSFLVPLLAALALASPPPAAPAAEGEEAVKRLASRLPGKGPYSVVWQNISTMPSEMVDQLRKTLESSVDLQPGAQELKVTFSENLRGFLVIAQGLEGKVWIESWPKPPAKQEKPAYRLVRTVIWEQASPILDVTLQGDDVFVLEPMRIGGKNLKPPVSLTLPRPMPRDPRGRIDIVNGGDNFRVLLPGVRCTGPLQKLACVIAKEPWIVAGRNYFEGSRGRYYTAAESGGALFQAETDGRTRVYTGGGDAVRVLEGWGSEIITIESGCGVHVLAALETGQLQAFQYSAGNIHASTVPMVLDGPVTAIWPSEKKNQVTVIVNNRTTGNYEASRVAVSCSE
jgi:hypothetical protein